MLTRFFSFALLLTMAGCSGNPTPGPTSSGSPTPAIPRPTSTPSAAGSDVELRKVARESAPVKLTASDGTGLELVTMVAKASVNGPLAFTELHLTFENPQDRVLEGHFEITLPEGAALSRLAMQNDNGWQEAEVVELQKAREAYEDSLHRRQDPALLEKAAGNQFQARIFPIPGRSKKEIVLSYSQELGPHQDYVLPLAGLPKIRSLEVAAQVWQGPQAGTRTMRYARQGEAPAGDFVIARNVPVQGLVKDDLVLVSVHPEVKTDPVRLDNLLVLVDTSASRSLGYGAQLDGLKALLDGLGNKYPSAKVEVAAFDQNVLDQGQAPLKAASALVEKLRKRTPLGATDLEGALKWAAQQKGFSRVLLVSDGVGTVGGSTLSPVTLKKAGIDRLDVLAVGGIRDKDAVRPLTEGLDGLVVEAESKLDDQIDALTHKAVSGIKVGVEGALWVWPETLEGVRAGEERLVYAQVSHPPKALKVKLSGKVQQEESIPLTPVAWPLLERSAVRARIARLTRDWSDEEDPKEKEDLKQQVVAMSTKFRVVSDFTSLLVLEGDADYARFGIERNALADILVVGQQGVEVQHREHPVVAKLPPPQNPVALKRDLFAQQGVDKDAGDAMQLKKTGIREPMALSAPAGSAPAAPSANYPAFTSVQGLTERDSEVSGRGAAAPAAAREAPSAASGGQAPVQNGSNSLVGDAQRLRREDEPTYDAPVASESLIRPHHPRPAVVHHASPRRRRARVDNYFQGQQTAAPEETGAAPLTGELAEIHKRINAHQDAVAYAAEWLKKQPGDVLALVGYGDALAAAGQKQEASRAYGSIIDLFPGRADLRRFAGTRLESLGKEGDALAADSYAKARDQRPDHPSSHRLVAYAQLRAGHYREAFESLEKGCERAYPPGRFMGCERILREDLAIAGAAWAAHEPSQRANIEKRLAKYGMPIDNEESLRFVLTWETDANDVDFHIKDSRGGHAFYGAPNLPSGGSLYADVTTGYGPECFNIPGGGDAFPYHLSIHYFSRGPMGYGMGKVEVMQHDGKGGLKFLERPYLVMNDQAFVQLGTIDAPL